MQWCSITALESLTLLLLKEKSHTPPPWLDHRMSRIITIILDIYSTSKFLLSPFLDSWSKLLLTSYGNGFEFVEYVRDFITVFECYYYYSGGKTKINQWQFRKNKIQILLRWSSQDRGVWLYYFSSSIVKDSSAIIEHHSNNYENPYNHYEIA